MKNGIDRVGNVHNYPNTPDGCSYPEFVHHFADAYPQLFVPFTTAPILAIPMFSTF
jgi:hypothetical protein